MILIILQAIMIQHADFMLMMMMIMIMMWSVAVWA